MQPIKVKHDSPENPSLVLIHGSIIYHFASNP
jgi:hypothetical protein